VKLSNVLIDKFKIFYSATLQMCLTYYSSVIYVEHRLREPNIVLTGMCHDGNRNFRSHVLSLPGTFVPQNKSDMEVHSLELSFP